MYSQRPAYQLNLYEKYVTTIVGTLSVFGAAIIILAYTWVDNSPKTPLWRSLMIFLSIFDMQQGAYYISVGLFNYTEIGMVTPLCTAIGISNVYATTAAYICTGCIAYLVHDIIQPVPRVVSGKLIYLTFLGYPLIISAVAWAANLSRPVITPDVDQYGCYINKDNELLRWVASYIPMVVSWVVCSVYNFTAYRRLKQVSDSIGDGNDRTNNPTSESGNAVIRNMMRRLLIVPFGLIVLRLPDLSFRLLELCNNSSNTNVAEWFVLLQSALNPMQGAWNCVLLAIYSKRLRQHFLEWCCCGRCSFRSSDEERIHLIASHTPYSSIDPRAVENSMNIDSYTDMENVVDDDSISDQRRIF